MMREFPKGFTRGFLGHIEFYGIIENPVIATFMWKPGIMCP